MHLAIVPLPDPKRMRIHKTRGAPVTIYILLQARLNASALPCGHVVSMAGKIADRGVAYQ
jgi:hypothetical protein